MPLKTISRPDQAESIQARQGAARHCEASASVFLSRGERNRIEGKGRQPGGKRYLRHITTRRHFYAVGGYRATAWLSVVQAQSLALVEVFPNKHGIAAERRPNAAD